MSDLERAILEAVNAVRADLAEVKAKLEYREAVFVGWKQVADYLSLSEHRCRMLSLDPDDPLPYTSVGGHIEVVRSELDAWNMRRHKRGKRRKGKMGRGPKGEAS